MTKTIAVIVGVVMLLALLLFSMTYTVNFHEVAIKTRFGELTEDSIVKEPGLKFRLPLFADQVKLYDTRLQLRESPLELVETSDKQQVVVKAYMMWKINTDGNGPLDFHGSYPDVREANDQMIDQFRTALRSGVSRFTFDELAGSETKLKEAEQAISDAMLAMVGKTGVKPVSVGISQLILSPKTTMAVLSRMEATRKSLSDAERIQGGAAAQEVRSRADKEAKKIRAFAEQRAAEIRTKGEEAAAEILAEMGQEQELAVFLQWIDAMDASLSENTTLVIPTSFAPFNLMDLKTPVDDKGLPLLSPQIPTPETTSPPAASATTPANAGGGT
jgi:modulator of FtsH protease HflC